jgi:hypothetical protein
MTVRHRWKTWRMRCRPSSSCDSVSIDSRHNAALAPLLPLTCTTLSPLSAAIVQRVQQAKLSASSSSTPLAAGLVHEAKEALPPPSAAPAVKQQQQQQKPDGMFRGLQGGFFSSAGAKAKVPQSASRSQPSLPSSSSSSLPSKAFIGQPPTTSSSARCRPLIFGSSCCSLCIAGCLRGGEGRRHGA